MAEVGDKHWVEDLFPASFGLTLEDILKDELPREDTADIPDMAHSLHKKEDSVFTRLAHNSVSRHDVDTIKNVYERVWLMKHFENEERKKREEEEDEREVPVYHRGMKITGKTKRVKSTGTSTGDLMETIDVQDSCIWNTNEIGTLRSVFRTAKEQNKKLQVELMETLHQFEKLQAKYNKEHIEHETQTRQLRDATKANERLGILAKNLKDQVHSATKQIDGLKCQIASMKSDRTNLMKDVHELRIAADHERLDRKKAELELQHHTSEALRERRINEENLKLIHEEDIQFLQKTIEELTDELNKEKKDHERTKRGLNHLRQHFSSLSIHEQSPEGSVKDDQLKTFTY